MELVCHLCRRKFDADTEAQEVRCPGCGGKIPPARLKEAAARAARVTARSLACPSCLHVVKAEGAGPQVCRYCGADIDPEEGERLVGSLGGLEAEARKALVEGEGPDSVVQRVQARGLAAARAWEFVERHQAELPFDRYKVWKEGGVLAPPPICDACGGQGPLSSHEAVWGLDPDEMKRYRSGFGGFEGDFGSLGHYRREALYFLCQACLRKSRTPEFARAYPARFGYRLEQFKAATP